jgi:hypothetical protein
MPTIMPSWSNKVDLISAESLAGASASTSEIINLISADYDMIEIQVKIVHNVSADAGCTIEFFRSNDSGTTLDNVSLYPASTVYTTDYIRTFSFSDLTYLSVKVTNTSSNAGHTATVTITYRGRNWIAS